MVAATRILKIGLAASVFFSVLAFQSSASQSASAPSEVWIGAPFSGTLHDQSGCAETRGNTCPFPSKHWTAYGGNWSIDLPKVAGSGVYLYLAPQHARDGVTAKVEAVSEACKEGRSGGKVVRVGVYLNKKKVGTVAYSHIANPAKVGDIVRWGGKIGLLYKTDKPHELCWTGSHLHLEVSSNSGFSCYNKGLTPKLKYSETNFFGFVTGARAPAARMACP